MPEGEGEAKAPRRVHLESLARQGDPGAEAELASIPELPPLGAHLWRYWNDLSTTRPVNGMALARISRLEIGQWERDEGVTLERWERRTILKIDAAYVAIMNGGEWADPDEEEGEAEHG